MFQDAYVRPILFTGEGDTMSMATVGGAIGPAEIPRQTAANTEARIMMCSLYATRVRAQSKVPEKVLERFSRGNGWGCSGREGTDL